MSTFPPTTDELFETFDDLQEWDERYDFIIDLGRELPALTDDLKTEDNIVQGCMSTVWMHATVSGQDQPVTIKADSDSLIVKGLIVVMMAFFHELSAGEIVQADVSEFLGKLGLNQHLSPQRRNGLFAMIKRLKQEVANGIGSTS